MGIIKAALDAVGGALADQWLEVIEADSMGDTTVFTTGVAVRRNDKRNNNFKGSAGTVSNGSVIHVYPGQFMMLVDGGKIVDYTAEPGYFKVDNSSAPSMFNGELGEAIKDTFARIKFGGVPSYSQKVYFINLQEIKGIKFGTRSPVNYFDQFYNAELFLRAHGTYSIKITDPIKFYTEALPKNAYRVDIGAINEQYLSEFLEALQAAVNRMSADGIRISYVASKSRELSAYMANELDADWKALRGMEVLSVGIASVSYDEESKKLINMRNQGAMLGDAAIREGYVQGAMARGFEAAGSNQGGSAQAFMGMGMGMNAGGGFMAAASQTNSAQMARDAEEKKAAAEAAASGWTCACGAVNQGKFCSECGAKKPEAAASWTCACGAVNTGKFCSECGAKKPEDSSWFCSECGHKNEGAAKFCSECGTKRA
ncbi:MAG: virion core protein [Ruminococcaceae bacterium]|nr:virion core protein [Oscillospiraceae bacterium]MBE6698004.1 virion core protein [Oscillospiraceae bacterium]